MSRRGISSFVPLLVIGLALALALLFLWRVWSFERQIAAGKTVRLPQFENAFTSVKNAGPAAGAFADVATPDDPSLGPADAKLVIVEFLDYECPFCNAESSIVRELAAKYNDKVRFIIRDFPVTELHPHAMDGALAAGCAQAQGKYWPMHDRLFAAAADGDLSPEDIQQAAAQSGLDLDVFHACLNVQAPLAEIQQDVADGLAAGVRGTPTFFFNGTRVEGAVPKDAFENLILRYVGP